MSLQTTPSQTLGPYFAIGLSGLNRADLAAGAAGTSLVISGRVTDGQGQPVSDAQLEIWQANAEGFFGSTDPRPEGARFAAWNGFGRIPTDGDGRFTFRTVRPGPVPGPGGSTQAPHIVVLIGMRGLLKHLYTRIYFSDADNEGDPVLALVPAGRRATLLAARQSEAEYRWDVRLQGDGETVFFDY